MRGALAGRHELDSGLGANGTDVPLPTVELEVLSWEDFSAPLEMRVGGLRRSADTPARELGVQSCPALEALLGRVRRVEGP